MKNLSVQNNLYFSAYPLKAIPASCSDQSAESSVLHITSKTKTSGRIRVHPMANPYKKEEINAPVVKKIKPTEDTGENINGWYCSYE
jgi:hypothetical protein